MVFAVSIHFFVEQPRHAALASSVAGQLEDMQQQFSLFNSTWLGLVKSTFRIYFVFRFNTMIQKVWMIWQFRNAMGFPKTQL